MNLYKVWHQQMILNVKVILIQKKYIFKPKLTVFCTALSNPICQKQKGTRLFWVFIVLRTYNFGEHVAPTPNDEVDEQKKIETSATDTCVQGQANGFNLFFEVSFKVD